MADNDRLIRAIDVAETNAYGSEDDSELSTHRALSLDAYAGKNIEPAPDGRSQVVDWTVFETIQWILPSLTRIFAGGDNVVEFEPFDEEDEESAQQESDFLNYQVTKKTNWFMTCLTWFQDALLTKNAYCLAFIDETLKAGVETYKGQSIEAVQLLLDNEGVELLAKREFPDPDDTEKLIDPTNGQPIPEEQQEQALQAMRQQGIQPQIEPPRSLFDIEIRKTVPTKKLALKVLPPERVLVDGNAPDHTTENADYFEYFEHTTISDLRSQGFDVDDDIAAEIEADSQEDASRDVYGSLEDSDDFTDPSLRIVKARTIWIRFDEDGDGIAELQKVVRVGNEILAHEPASRIPVASIVPFINTHRHIGTSVSDLVFDIQRIKTAILRAGLDSLYLSTNPRHAVSDKVNLDDLLVSRPGGAVRLRDGAIPGEGHVMPLATEFVFPQAQAGLQHMDSVTEARVGVSRIFQGIDASASNDHNRIGQLNTMAAQRVEQIARIFANGVEYLFSLAHELVIKSGHSSETIKLRGKWVQVDPAGWKTGRDLNMVAPFSAGNKDSLLQRLMLLGPLLEKGAQLGIVDAENAYEYGLEVAKAADVQGTKFFTDPATLPPPEPPPPDPTMIALQIEDKKVDNKAADDQADAELEKYKTDTDAAVKQAVAKLQSDTQIALAQIKAGQSVDLETLKSNLKNAPIELGNQAIAATGQAVAELNAQVADSIQQITDAVSELKLAADAPREVVRDKSGKVTGVRVNGKVKPVQRDSDGRVTGL